MVLDAGPSRVSDLYRRSKIASLAEETLVHIFSLGAATEPHHPDALRDATTLPVMISHVCRRWRSIALHTARLWSRIFVCRSFELVNTSTFENGASRTSSHSESALLCRIQVFLERSKSSRLSVYVDVRSPLWFARPNDCGNLFSSKHMSMLLDYLLPHADRWEEVEIISDTWEPFAILLERCSTSQDDNVGLRARSLRRLALVRTNAYVAFESPQSISDPKTRQRPFLSMPALRYVELAGVHVNWTHFDPCNLTELSLKYHSMHVLPTAAQLIDIISSSPGMESLSLHGWGVQSFEDGSNRLEGRLSLKNLKRLSIGWIDAHYCRRLLSLFSWHFPILESFTVEDVRNGLDPLSTQDSSCVLDYISSRSLENGRGCRPRAAFDLILNSVCASFDSVRRLTEALPPSRSVTLHNVNDELLSFLEHLQQSGESVLFLSLSRVIMRTSSTSSKAKASQIARNLMSSSSRRITVEIEDLLESDEEIASFKEDTSEGGGVRLENDSYSLVGDDSWLDPAAEETINQQEIVNVAQPYAFRDYAKIDYLSGSTHSSSQSYKPGPYDKIWLSPSFRHFKMRINDPSLTDRIVVLIGFRSYIRTWCGPMASILSGLYVPNSLGIQWRWISNL